MSVGTTATSASLNQQLTDAAIQLRDVCQRIRNLSSYAAKKGTDGLEGVGFDPADVPVFLTKLGYLSTVAGVYFGTVQQGGTGGSGAEEYDFNDGCSDLWAGQ